MNDIRLLPDIQNEPFTSKYSIDEVGIIIDMPVRIVQLSSKNYQHTVARIKASIWLDKNKRGANMSRFVETLESINPLQSSKLCEIARQLGSKMESVEIGLEFNFKYFMTKQAPISKLKGTVSYDCAIGVHLFSELRFDYNMVRVRVPVISVCPCSKAISERSAHNQRAYVTINCRVAPEKQIWLEELIWIAEASASSPIYSVLKREDEKYITEQSYAGPMFVEDIVRNVASQVDDFSNQNSFAVHYSAEVESIESIHNHNAYAVIKR